MADPIHQFEIQKIVTLGHIGGHEIAFTNSSLFMAITVVGIAALLVGGSASRALVPGRMQSIAELSYEFVANTIQSTAVSTSGLGTGQSWSAQTRSVGTWYQNSTSKPIMINISRNGANGASNILYVQSTNVTATEIAARCSVVDYGGASAILSAIVPPGYYYQLTGTAPNYWWEFR